MEQWKPVVGFEGLYEVSNLGRVCSLRTKTCGKRGGCLSQSKVTGGYWRVTLTKDRKDYSRTVHVLVALAFLGPRPKNYEVNHEDGVKDNNWLTNLCYRTKSYNQQHAIRFGLRVMPKGDRHWNMKISEARINAIKQDYKAGLRVGEIARKYQLGIRYASKVLRTRCGIQPVGGRFGLRFCNADIVEMKRRVDSGDLVKDVAADYGVTQSFVSKAIKGEYKSYNL